MKQLELYPNRDAYRLWCERSDQWFSTFADARKYLVANKIYAVKTKTMTHTEMRLLNKAGIRVYKPE